MTAITYLAVMLLLAGCTRSDNSTSSSAVGDSCGLQPEAGPWSAALEDWVTAERVIQGRHGRIMALPPSQGYYVSERIDLMPPPPPPPHHYQHGQHYMHHRGPYPAHHASGPQHGPPPERAQESPNSQLQIQPGLSQGPASLGPPPSAPPSPGSGQTSYDEWQATPPPPPGAGKILNRPPNPYKDQFKPSYPPPSPPQASIPVHTGLSDRVDETRPPPHKQVSETDLFLLGAIEKLVYRVDIMEKRLRKMEENMHYLVAGTEAKPDPCQANYTRVGGSCYSFSSEALNWKNANYACRKLKGHLLELDDDEKRQFSTGLLADKNLKGYDFWTGGLNPGLLWIWSHSAKAVANATDTSSTTIVGEGRCLALIHDPTVNSYVYRGQDCALRHRFVCEKNEDKTKLGNEIERVAKKLREGKRIPKMKWIDEELV